jgi:hypothetical protein
MIGWQKGRKNGVGARHIQTDEVDSLAAVNSIRLPGQSQPVRQDDPKPFRF